VSDEVGDERSRHRVQPAGSFASLTVSRRGTVTRSLTDIAISAML
jgi:hypothetical protein